MSNSLQWNIVKLFAERFNSCDNGHSMMTASKLQSRSLYQEGGWRILMAGSKAEQLALETGWGHPDTDWDLMYLNGGPMGVYVAGGHQKRGQSCLEICLDGCPAGYCKLEVTNASGLRESTVNYGPWYDDSCIVESDGKWWLNIKESVLKMAGGAYHLSSLTCAAYDLRVELTSCGNSLTGPARDLKTELDDIFCNQNISPTVSGPAAHPKPHIDLIQTFVCSAPHPDLHEEFQTRQRGSWPPVSLIQNILQLPMFLVLVGHKGSPESEFKLQARMSWSHSEFKLIQELPESVRQGYISCKYVIKRFLEAQRSQNIVVYGRSRVCSYHLKVVFLRFLEKRPPSRITSPFRLFLDLLHELDEYLKVGTLPHYFLPQCNLLETVADDERGIARQVITKILSNPLNALLTSPTAPQEIYGEVHPDHLVSAFSTVSSHPTCEKSWNDLSELLTRVDERRRRRYRDQCKEDEREDYWVSERAELTGLVGMLKHIKPH